MVLYILTILIDENTSTKQSKARQSPQDSHFELTREILQQGVGISLSNIVSTNIYGS